LYSFPNELAALSLEQITRTLAEQVYTQLTFVLSKLSQEDQDRFEQARSFGHTLSLVNILLILARDYTPLLLIDNAENIPSSDWSALESQLIEPLVSAGQSLVIVAGRRQVLNWKRFEVRRRVMEPDKSHVGAFDEETVSKQIHQHAYDVPVELIFPYTGGNPLLVDALAQHIVEWKRGVAGEDLNHAWLDQRQGGILQILRASEAKLLENVPTALLSVLYAVSPLRFYRLEALRYMLIRSEIESADRAEGYYLNLLHALDQQTDVVWWNRERRAYVTSQDVRQIVNRRQLLEDPDVYVGRHTQACDMYWGWVKEYPEASEDFILEIWFHLASRYLADSNADVLHTETMRALEFARTHLKKDRFIILPEQLRGDRELLDLLPDDLRGELMSALGL